MSASTTALLLWKKFGKKLPTFKFDLTQATFLAGMAKRNSAGPFAAGVLSQGNRAASTTAMDVISYTDGTKIAGSYFYPKMDYLQANVVFWITPEWAGNEAVTRLLWGNINATSISKTDGGLLNFRVGGVNVHNVDISAWTAGTTYCVSVAWDAVNPLDGTNYVRISINDVHSFGRTTTFAPAVADNYIGGMGALYSSSNALIEGLTVYRRPLWDGAYGVNVGNGDEINLIYAAGAGADPCTITGSWDVCLAVPTNSTVGALATGTGEAWSHPHSSNLLTDGWLQSYYGNQWGVALNGSNASINYGSDAGLDNLQDNEFTAECWIRCNATAAGSYIIFDKGFAGGAGWFWYLNSTDTFTAQIKCATTDVNTVTNAISIRDGKWHHVVLYFNDAGDRKIYLAVDGVWCTYAAQTAGVGAIVSDAANSLYFSRRQDTAAWFWNGAVGWTRISNNARYTAGTNFVPVRAAPVSDANTIALWQVDEGTGNTLDNDEGTAGRDGTITNGVWQPQWYPEGTPIVPTSMIGSATYSAIVGSGATIDDLPDNAFTVDGWFRFPKTGAIQYFSRKGSGWRFSCTDTGILEGRITCATTDARSQSSSRWDDNRWHYYKGTFDDAGDRKIRIYVDNVEVGYTLQTAGNGAITSDAADNGYIGASSFPLTGAHGWVRWSNVVRGAGMTSRSIPPAVDANTMGQWNTTEGYGAVLTDSSGNANHAALTGTYTWVNTGAMDVDSPGARVYLGGDASGSDAVNEGIKQTWTGLTAGSNYVLRASAYSEDGVGIPKVIVYDETNAAQVTAMTGLATSTEWTPDMLLFSFELPTNARGAAADCTSISIKLISTTAGNVGWHQCELYTNLIDNPSLDTGAVADPWVPYGWTSSGLDAGDTERETVTVHSEGGSFQGNGSFSTVETVGYGIANLGVGKFLSFGGWGYGAANNMLKAEVTQAVKHSTLATEVSFSQTAGASWQHFMSVLRDIAVTGQNIAIWGAFAVFYLDDLYAVALDDVTLTVTPASQANSLEGTGIRVDGLDRLTQTITAIQAGKGRVTFTYTPRHSASTVALFGNATPVIAHFYADANNYILLDWSAANTIRLRYNAGGAGVQTGTYNATGAIVAGTAYNFDLRYTGAGMKLYINSALVLTISAGVSFSTVPTTAYWGSDSSTTQQNDFVIS